MTAPRAVAAAATLLRACSLLLCLVPGSRQLSLTELVVPEAVEAGGDAELRCQYALAANESQANLYVKWWWMPTGASSVDRKLMYQRIEGQTAELGQQRSEMEIKENDTLVLHDLKPSNSGTYQCEVSNIAEIRQDGVLTVYTKGTGPQLNISSLPEGSEDLLIECEAADVAPLPNLIVTMSDGNEINMTEVLTGPNKDGLYNISASAIKVKAQVVPGDVRCELHYVNPKISHPQFIDTETYDPAAGEPPVTEPPGLDPAPATADVSAESLQNSRDAGYKSQSSWALPAVAAILVHLHVIL